MPDKKILSAKNIVVILGAVAGIAGCMVDIVGTFIFSARVGGYDAMTSSMSQLGVSSSPVAAQIAVWWIVMGLLLMCFGATFRLAFPATSRDATIATWLIIVYAVGEGLGSALLPADKAGTAHTWIGLLHDLLGELGVISMMIFPLFMIKIRPDLRVFYRIIFVSGFAFVILFSLGRLMAHHENSIVLYKGLWQRMYMIVYYLGLIVTAYVILKDQFNKTRDFR